MMEAILGGELFYLIKYNGKFPEKTARFYASCVVLAFEHIHSKNVIFRDLKPENLLISSNGYVKLVDFGFAKKRNNSCTLCGTPEYLAPEIITCLHQSFTSDWWALGIFLYEMIYGKPPFQDDSNSKMYEKILTSPVIFPKPTNNINKNDKKYVPNITNHCQSFIKSLLQKHAHKRLGAFYGTKNIKSHPFFDNLDWDKLKNMDVEPPYIPKIKNQEDMSNFEYFPSRTVDEVLIYDPNGALFKWCDDF